MNSPNPPEGPYPIPPDDVELLKKYRDIVMPAARLAGYDDFAKWLFTIAAVIGTLGAAFSNAALKGLGGAGVTVFFLAIVATAISLALAVIQRSVDIPKLNWHDLDDMLKKTEAALRVKRARAWIAGTFFAAAIILAGLAPLLTARTAHHETRNSLTYSYGKDGIHATVSLAEPSGTESEIAIAAQSASNETLIAAQRATADFSGVVRLDVTSSAIPVGSTGVSMSIHCDVKSNKVQNLVIPFQRPTLNGAGQNTGVLQGPQFVSCL